MLLCRGTADGHTEVVQEHIPSYMGSGQPKPHQTSFEPMSDQTPIQTSTSTTDSPPLGLELVAADLPWRGEVLQRLEELVRLEPGWDGYDGEPVSLENAVFALRMLEAACRPDSPAPQIVPGNGGDLQIEWHEKKAHIELHIREPYAVNAWRSLRGRTAEGEEHELTHDFTIVATWISQLTE